MHQDEGSVLTGMPCDTCAVGVEAPFRGAAARALLGSLEFCPLPTAQRAENLIILLVPSVTPAPLEVALGRGVRQEVEIHPL